MKKPQYVVRVAINPHDKNFQNPFLECLRYAGVVIVHNETIFDIRCPDPKWDSEYWAEHNAARMASFGYNAVKAPSAGKDRAMQMVDKRDASGRC